MNIHTYILYVAYIRLIAVSRKRRNSLSCLEINFAKKWINANFLLKNAKNT